MRKLAAEEFLQDGRLAEARRLVAEALREHQGKLTGVRAADGERKIAYEEMLKGFGEMRGGNLYYRYLGSGFGAGALVELADGSVKYDMISGIGVHHLGHGSAAMVNAGLEAAVRDTVMQGNLQQNVESAELSRVLLERAGAGSKLAHCFLTTSGAMANENALKLAFQKKAGATRILAFEHAFAGRTMALSQITDKAAYRVGLPTVLAVDYVPFFDAEKPAESTARAVAVLRGHLARFPGAHAALWCEFVQGEGGFYAGEKGFFEAIFAAVREKQVAVVADEIQTFGRTSRLFAFQHFGVEQWVDIVTVGKMLQVCATLFADAMKPGPGLLSQTFTAATAALFGGQAMLRELETAGVLAVNGRNMAVNARFAQRLAEIGERHAGWVKGPFGLGGMIAFTPFDGSDEKVKKLLAALFENGVVAFTNGSNPARVRFLPPVPVMTDAQIDEVCGILERTMVQIAGGG